MSSSFNNSNVRRCEIRLGDMSCIMKVHIQGGCPTRIERAVVVIPRRQFDGKFLDVVFGRIIKPNIFEPKIPELGPTVSSLSRRVAE
jgi:hypothetical protein